MKNPKPLSAKPRCLIDPPPTSFPRRRASLCGGKPQSLRTGHRTVGATLVVAPAAPRRGLPWPCTRPSLIHRHCERSEAIRRWGRACPLAHLPICPGRAPPRPPLALYTAFSHPSSLRGTEAIRRWGRACPLARLPRPSLTETPAPARSKPST